MADDELARLERAWRESGDGEASLLAARRRLGQVSDERLRYAAHLGSAAARAAIGARAVDDHDIPAWLAGLTDLHHQEPGEPIDATRTVLGEVAARLALLLAQQRLKRPTKALEKRLAALRGELMARGVSPRVGHDIFELAAGPLPHLLVEAARGRILRRPWAWHGAVELLTEVLDDQVAGAEGAMYRAYRAAERALDRSRAVELPTAAELRELGRGLARAQSDFDAARALIRDALVPWLVGHDDPLAAQHVEPPPPPPPPARPPENILGGAQGRARELLERVLAGTLERHGLFLAACLAHPDALEAVKAGGGAPVSFAGGGKLGQLDRVGDDAWRRTALVWIARVAAGTVRQAACHEALQAVDAWLGAPQAEREAHAAAARQAANRLTELAQAENRGQRFSQGAALRAAALAATAAGAEGLFEVSTAARQAVVSAANVALLALPMAERPSRPDETATWQVIAAALVPWALGQAAAPALPT